MARHKVSYCMRSKHCKASAEQAIAGRCTEEHAFVLTACAGWASPVPSLAALGRVTSEQPPSCSRSVSTSSAAHGNSEK